MQAAQGAHVRHAVHHDEVRGLDIPCKQPQLPDSHVALRRGLRKPRRGAHRAGAREGGAPALRPASGDSDLPRGFQARLGGGGEGARLQTDVVEAVAEGEHEGNVPADHRLGLAADRAVRDRERCGAGGRVGAVAERIIMEIVEIMKNWGDVQRGLGRGVLSKALVG